MKWFIPPYSFKAAFNKSAGSPFSTHTAAGTVCCANTETAFDADKADRASAALLLRLMNSRRFIMMIS